MKGKQKIKGFTMIELMIAVAIMCLLTLIVIAALQDNRAKARDTKRIDELKTLSYAAETYFSENYEWPESIDDLAEYFNDNEVPEDPFGESYFYAKLAQGYCFGAMVETEALENDETCEGEGAEYPYKLRGPSL